MKKTKITFQAHKNTSEEMQPTGFHYSFVSAPASGRAQCHTWIKCRDFLQDAVRNKLTGRNDSIYSFTYDPSKDPAIDLTRMRMLVKRLPAPRSAKEENEFEEMMKAGLKLVNHFENYAKLKPKSFLMRVENDDAKNKQVYVFCGPGAWVKSPVMITLYTFLIRLGYFKLEFTDEKSLDEALEKLANGPNQSNDTRYLKVVKPHLYKVLDHLDLHSFKQGKEIMYADTAINNFHHHSGVVSLCQFRTPNKELNEKFKEIVGKK